MSRKRTLRSRRGTIFFTRRSNNLVDVVSRTCNIRSTVRVAVESLINNTVGAASDFDEVITIPRNRNPNRAEERVRWVLRNERPNRIENAEQGTLAIYCTTSLASRERERIRWNSQINLFHFYVVWQKPGFSKTELFVFLLPFLFAIKVFWLVYIKLK